MSSPVALPRSCSLILEPRLLGLLGLDINLMIRADTLALRRIWLVHQPFSDALGSPQIELNGPRDLVRNFPGWLALRRFAAIPGA